MSSILVKNIQYHESVPFEEYLKMPGYSFSGIKNHGKVWTEPTEKMKLGSSVDDYLNDPSRFNGDLSIVKPLALKLKERVGNLYPKFKKQLSITADFYYEGMMMKYKGRTDWAIPNFLVVDIKVSESIKYAIDFFDYPNQISGYCIPMKSNYGILLSINPKTKEVNSINIPLSDLWWKKQILKFGKPY